MEAATLIDLENSLQTSSLALRHAVKLTTANGMTISAKDLASILLVLERVIEEVSSRRTNEK